MDRWLVQLNQGEAGVNRLKLGSALNDIKPFEWHKFPRDTSKASVLTNAVGAKKVCTIAGKLGWIAFSRAHAPPPRMIQMVMRKVPMRTQLEELGNALVERYPGARMGKRIILTNGRKSLVVRFRLPEVSAAELLSVGRFEYANIFSFEVELAHHIKCHRCSNFGHSSRKCKRKAVCQRCNAPNCRGREKGPRACKKRRPYCARCKANHFCGGLECPARLAKLRPSASLPRTPTRSEMDHQGFRLVAKHRRDLSKKAFSRQQKAAAALSTHSSWGSEARRKSPPVDRFDSRPSHDMKHSNPSNLDRKHVSDHNSSLARLASTEDVEGFVLDLSMPSPTPSDEDPLVPIDADDQDPLSEDAPIRIAASNRQLQALQKELQQEAKLRHALEEKVGLMSRRMEQLMADYTTVRNMTLNCVDDLQKLCPEHTDLLVCEHKRIFRMLEDMESSFNDTVTNIQENVLPDTEKMHEALKADVAAIVEEKFHRFQETAIEALAARVGKHFGFMAVTTSSDEGDDSKVLLTQPINEQSPAPRSRSSSGPEMVTTIRETTNLDVKTAQEEDTNKDAIRKSIRIRKKELEKLKKKQEEEKKKQEALEKRQEKEQDHSSSEEEVDSDEERMAAEAAPNNDQCS